MQVTRMKKKDINKMTRADFARVPHVYDVIDECSWEDTPMFDSLVIMPAELKVHWLTAVWLFITRRRFDRWEFTEGLHDSNYRCMEFCG